MSEEAILVVKEREDFFVSRRPLGLLIFNEFFNQY